MMAKRILEVPFIGDDALLVKRAKLSEHLPIQESDTIIETLTLPSNYKKLSDGGNKFSSKSEKERHKLSAKGDKAEKKQECTSRNATKARYNRIKKKTYITRLELKTSELEVQNKSLQHEVKENVEEIAALKREVLYLKNVIRNRTEIGTLLNCIHKNTNLKMTSSILGNSAQNNTEVSKPNISMKKPKDILKSPSTKTPTFSNSDKEGKTLVCNYRNPSYNLINNNDKNMSLLKKEDGPPTLLPLTTSHVTCHNCNQLILIY